MLHFTLSEFFTLQVTMLMVVITRLYVYPKCISVLTLSVAYQMNEWMLVSINHQFVNGIYQSQQSDDPTIVMVQFAGYNVILMTIYDYRNSTS
jgi:hypothetical protein